MFPRALKFSTFIVGRRMMAKATDSITSAAHIKPSNFDKKLLIWFGKQYKKAEDIPATVPAGSLAQARTSFRIWINITTFTIALGCCLGAIQYGKHQANQGKSLHKMSMERRAEYAAEQRSLDNGKNDK